MNRSSPRIFSRKGYLDHYANDESFGLLKPLLRDPKMDVRLWATHSISCERCKEGECPVDFVPLLVERTEIDVEYPGA